MQQQVTRTEISGCAAIELQRQTDQQGDADESAKIGDADGSAGGAGNQRMSSNEIAAADGSAGKCRGVSRK